MLEVSVEGARPPLDILAAIHGVVDVQAFGDRAHVRVHGVPLEDAARAVQDALTARGILSASIRPVPASLEDVFIDLIGTSRGAAQTRGEVIKP
jgi:hypothetical protein